MLFNCGTVLVSLLQARHRLCCLLGSIRDAVALILRPQGTADMDVCKLLTWCCLLCSLIKDGAALLFHNLPSNMLQVSQTPCLSVSHLLLTRDSPWQIATSDKDKEAVCAFPYVASVTSL